MQQRRLLIIALLISSISSAVTFIELAGTYKISHPDVPIINTVKISPTGIVTLTEASPYGKIECSGSGKILADVLNSVVKCTNGRIFEQRINLQQVKNFKKFKAKVYSSLYGQ